LVELVKTTCEQLVDDLVAVVKYVVLGDWFQGQNLDVNLIFSVCI
jgi:hypothetical protein